MLINHVKIHNFGPYYGDQKLDLAPGGKPVTLIHGDNMRGKTSLLNAMRWCLYGSVRSRTGARMSLARLLNTDAVRDGDYSFSVEMSVVDDGKEYEITRQAKADRKPSADADFDTDLHVRFEGHFLAPDDADLRIRRLLPEDVSHFFLFDGEMLTDFENLLADASEQAGVIKESIEQILGVPALEHSIEDLQILLKDARKRRDREASSVNAAKRMAQRAEEVADEISAISEDQGEIDSQIAEARQRRAQIAERQAEFAGAKQDADRLQLERTRKQEAEGAVVELREQRKILAAGAWRDLMVAAIQPRLQEAERDQARIIEGLGRATELQARRRQLERALAGTEALCPTCGRGLGSEELDRLRRELEALPENEVPDTDALARLSTRAARLRAITKAESSMAVKSVEDGLRRQEIEVTKAENRISELSVKLRDHDEVEVARLQREHEALLKDEGALQHAVSEYRDRLATLNAEARKLSHQLSQVDDPKLTKLNEEVELLDNLLAVFDGSLDELRDQLRSVIERDASDIFLRLTTDKTYSGLSITESYGLFILDSDRNPVLVRSAGAEQIVALSLIGALNRNAVKRGPVIMDTPFGRLDPHHRRQILEFLPTMSEQVALLVHGGEVNRERDLDVISHHIQREYQLVYESSARTNIVPMGALA